MNYEKRCKLFLEYKDDALRDHRDHIIRAFVDGLTPSDVLDSTQFIPRSSPSLLAALSSRVLSARENFALSVHIYVVLREVQSLVDTGKAGVASQSRSLERLLRSLNDLVLRSRYNSKTMGIEIQKTQRMGVKDDENGAAAHDGDADAEDEYLAIEQRATVFSCRSALINALRNVALMPETKQSVRDSVRIAARRLRRKELAYWLCNAGILDHAMLDFGDDARQANSTALAKITRGQIFGHRIEQCSIGQLWLTIRRLSERWPYLPHRPHIVALVELLSRRIAFFLAYRERVSGPSVTAARQNTVLGLTLDMWAPTKTDSGSGVEPEAPKTLLDNALFVQETGDGKYVHANRLFATETERLMSAFERQLRCAAGFSFCDSSVRCLASEQLRDIGQASVERFNELCDEQVSGAHKTFVSESFGKNVYACVMRPSDAERFRVHNPFDCAQAQNIVSNQRRALYNQMNKLYVEPPMADVWKNLRHCPENPVYTLVGVLCANFALKQTTGSSLKLYYHKTEIALDPLLYNEERLGTQRSLFAEMYRQNKTTGTMKFFRSYKQTKGLTNAPLRHINYPHPLIVQSMNSIYVLYKGHLHEAELGFGQAFMLWLRLMCTDDKICGEMANESCLFELWDRLCAETGDERALLEQTLARRNEKLLKWDKLRTIFNTDDEQKTIRKDTRHTQL